MTYTMQASEPHSAPVASALAWLAAEPDDDPVADLAALRGHFGRVRDPAVPAAEFLRCLEQFDVRVLDICERFRARLLEAPLPLTVELRLPAEGLIDALLDLAAGFQRVLDDVRNRRMGAQRTDAHTLVLRALRLSAEAYLLACMLSAPAPAGFWLRTYALLATAERFEAAGAGDEAGKSRPSLAAVAEAILAVAALQPESLTGRELVWVRDYLDGVEVESQIGRSRPDNASSLYWMDVDADVPPTALSRREAPASGELFFFDSGALARDVARRLEWLELRVAQAEVVGLERNVGLLDDEGAALPAGLTPVEALSLLRRMHERWSVPPHRAAPRRQHEYTVQVCAGLRSIWEMFRRGEAQARIAEWMVYNESPGGYAIMSVSGVSGMLSAGMVLALRPDAGKPWTLCIVRWLRSDNPEQVELGLQVIAHGGGAATIAFRGGEMKTILPALVLPPLSGVRHNPAILVRTGSYASRRFVLVRDAEQRLYVAQGRVISLDMQTANIELLQYEIDPYPI
jgi:hypothetical protein